MSKFGTKSMPNIKGSQRFEQLVILPNGSNLSKIDLELEKGIWDFYREGLEDKYRKQFRGLEAIMERVANLQSMNKYNLGM